MKPLMARPAAIEYAMGSPGPAPRRRLLDRVAPRERGFFLELTSAVARRRLTLESVAAAYCRPALDRIEPRSLEIIVHALAEALFLHRTAWHAAVHEAVAMTRGGSKARGFVNGVLRAVQRDVTVQDGVERSAFAVPLDEGREACFGKPVMPDPDEHPDAWLALSHGFTAEAIARLQPEFDDQAALAGFLEASDRQAAITIRLRTGVSIDDLEAEDRDAIGDAIDGSPGVYLWDGADIAATESFRSGRITVQGPFASRVAPLVAPVGTERILDVCAAPGGKACHLSELAPDARVTALATTDAGREQIENGAARLGVTLETGLVNRRSSKWPDGPWNAILLDVPCSNSGVLDRRPEARGRLDSAHLEELISTQRSLLARALKALMESPGPGRVIYSSCSILACEGADVVSAITEGKPRVRIRHEERSMPGSTGTDGGYVAVMDVVES